MGDLPAPAEVAAALRRAGLADVTDGALSRALYSSDASLYRVVPAVVAWPREEAEVAAALSVCRDLAVPLTCRGAGTSIAGNAVGTGVVLDFSRHMGRSVSVNAEEQTATVQPGVVHARLQRAAAPHRLRFGPDPSTHTRCTIGGMIGNNSCGARSLSTGRTSDNVVSLDVLTAAGERLTLSGPTPGSAALPAGRELARLRALAGGGLATIRTEFGRFGRQVSGYALEHLLPEHGFDVRRALVGSEGTLAVVTSATVRLVAEPAHRTLAVLGYPDMPAAASATPDVLHWHPAACEGLDSRMVDVVRSRKGAGAVPGLPRGSAWLFVELTGDTAAEADSAAKELLATVDALDGMVVGNAPQAAALWRIREDGAGLSGRTEAGAPAYPGWEDSAVPVESLGPYVRDLGELMAERGLTGAPYGHFGEGCLHLRLDFPLDQPDGKAIMRVFLLDAARLAARYGGSLSGEHGDGRARSELLPLIYSPSAISLFRQVKEIFDPRGLLNPGVITEPDFVDDDVRAVAAVPVRHGLGQRYTHDAGDFSKAVHRCTGVGRCVADHLGPGQVMCPSYQATRNEKDSTRGRARVLQEMINGTLVTRGWRSREVAEALDLCLSCKACSSECPAGVDMAAYKSEVLFQTYRHRPRPRSHYALGRLPHLARLASLTPGLANGMLALPGLGALAKLAAGVDRRRSLPQFAAEPFRAWFAHRGHPRRDGRPVMLLADTFTNHFSLAAGQAAVRVLEDAGYTVQITPRPICCGLTWISTGQLTAARRILARTAAQLRPALRAGIPIVGLEPSCTAVYRSDAAELLDGATAKALAGSVKTLSELLLGAPGWQPPDLRGTAIVAQPHCHHRAVMGWDADAELLRRAGAEVTAVPGCCGLAGNFGAERGHYEVSAAIAEAQLLPAVRDAGPDAVVLADGFSCRTQLADLGGHQAVHLAQLLAGRR